MKQPTVSKHPSNIFRDGELEKDSVHSILEYTATDGKVYSTRNDTVARHFGCGCLARQAGGS